jgi:retron-type reverse transcriptase
MSGVSSAKPYGIAKRTVWEAYQQVKANRGAAGIDDETIAEFEQNRSKNLYKLWNRMSSGSYFPPPVKQVEIPKASGGTRKLGVPTVCDRVAQTVVKLLIEPELDSIFHADSYGYRPGRSAKQAVAITRERCWRYDWVVEFDIKAAFDQIDHGLLMKAVRAHIKEDWILLYIERWLVAPFATQDGARIPRERGTPQGGVVSPILMNLFMHYAFDTWMQRTSSNCPFARYADDAVVHCRSRKQAEYVMRADDATGEIEGRVLQGQQSHRTACACELHLPGLYVQTEEGSQQATSALHRLPAGSQRRCLAADATGGAPLATQSPDARVAGRGGSALQPGDTGVVAILWRVLPKRHARHLPAYRSSAGALGPTKVQGPSAPQAGQRPMAGQDARSTTVAVPSLARCRTTGWITGAV